MIDFNIHGVTAVTAEHRAPNRWVNVYVHADCLERPLELTLFCRTAEKAQELAASFVGTKEERA